MDRNYYRFYAFPVVYVALRKESVDRNRMTDQSEADRFASLSARRAWIEMTDTLVVKAHGQSVALRKESVDRNAAEIRDGISWTSRSPQGERG